LERNGAVNEFDEKTRVTQVSQEPQLETPSGNDCLVVIYTTEPALLGKRFVLEKGIVRIGRGTDNNIVLDGDSVSRRHAHVERRQAQWYAADDGSTNGTYVNERQIPEAVLLSSNDRIKVGPTIFKYLSGADAEAKYYEEIYKMTIVDGLTQIHNKRYLFEALEREIIRARRHTRALSVIMFDIDHFKGINDSCGHLAGDHVLRELAELVQSRIRRDEVFARYGGEEFAIVLPEAELRDATRLADSLRQKVQEHQFVFQGQTIAVTISLGCANVVPDDTAMAIIARADQKLYEAKRTGRNRVCS
jgi:two-component system, cell cycle response regulator